MDWTFPYLKRLLATIAFGIIMTVQCFLLAAYPATYENDPNWYAVTTTFVPVVCTWTYLVRFKAAKLRWLFYVWYLYVIFALVPNIVIIFVRVEDKLDKEKFLSPNTLKVILSLTPPLLLLLLHTAEDSDQSTKYKELVSRLAYRMTIDLFDVVNMIDIALDEGRDGHEALRNFYPKVLSKKYMCTNVTQPTLENLADLTVVPEGFGKGMVAVACFALLLSIFQLAENKLSEDTETAIHFRIAVARNVIQILFVNLVFLIMRAVVFFKYGKDESIFMAKNIMGIVLSILDIYTLCESNSTSFWSLCVSCFGLRRPH